MCYRFNKLTTLLEHEIHYSKKNKYSDYNNAERKWFLIHVTQYFEEQVNFQIFWGYFDCLKMFCNNWGRQQALQGICMRPQFSSQCAFLVCGSTAHATHLYGGLKNSSLKFLFHILIYTQIQAKRPEPPPFNLKCYSDLGNSYNLQFLHSPVHCSYPSFLSELHLH